MSYSDYGGYAFRNSQRVKGRSDVIINEGVLKASPGTYPGFAFPEIKGGQHYHVLLGDGPVHLGLYKQCSLGLYLRGKELDLDEYGLGYDDLDEEKGNIVTVVIEGCEIKVTLRNEDNLYIYAQLTEPDGTVWQGFSGYGVGAGLEDCGYGYRNEDRMDSLWEIFNENKD